MSRPVAVLRPEPGNARTATALAAAGLSAIRLPLFAMVPAAWQAPDPAGYDLLVATSANAFRHGGDGLSRLRSLPVHAVGAVTAAAARAAGFAVAQTGARDLAALATTLPKGARVLHLAGRERTMLIGATTLTVYAADPLPIAPAMLTALNGAVAMLHSARAARALGALVDAEGPPRTAIRLAALSSAIAAAAGGGWQAVLTADEPRDPALVAIAARLAD